MKRIISMFFVSCMLLSACSQQQHADANDTQMLQLQMLLTQSASFAVLPGDTARKSALDLARRGMSGPEMNAMHHGGGSQMPMMKTTHDLGDAVFEVLEAASQAGNKDKALQNQVLIAAQAALMRLNGKLLENDVGLFMQKQGQGMIDVSFHADADSPYDKAAIHLLELLNKTATHQATHANQH
ncbi:hypothetical protein D8Y20_03105 [Mariprofundus sp. EBB-1]|uniref:hypothetical protein n=1 Tax=Mariprofundus sp. EBB-1 TaxID=2650971 RepID=UPI000EF21B0B|nr:hypothetical protein [Mariprofundus sp. EBB-1]RLL54780.1 hypothetical protein D8Y20_03105 [Mariprofundus sp. EBB-1]